MDDAQIKEYINMLVIDVEQIKQYTDKLGLTCNEQACKDILDYANEFQIADLKTAVWEFLDTFEGIAHSRDPEYWEGEDDDE